MIKFYLFGGCRAETQAGESIAFATAKARALLAYLAMRPGHWHSRQALADLLWPTATEAVALSNLRNTLVRLRKSLDNPDWIQATRQGIQLTCEPHQLWTDATTFDYLWEHLNTPDPIHGLIAPDEWEPYCARWLAEAVALYQGEFLAGLFWKEEDDSPFWQWRRQTQETYHAKVISLLDQLVAYQIGANDYHGAAEHARRQLALEPWREQAHRQLMIALARTGDYTGALAQYENCRQIIHTELRLAPEPETEALLQQLQAERQSRTERKSAIALAQPVSMLASNDTTQGELLHLRTVTQTPNNLPAQLSPFVGRTTEVEQLHAALCAGSYRLHVIVGPGGMGKSRLALHVAALQLDYFVDGVFFTPLAETPIVDDVLPAIARSLILPIHDELPLRQQLVAHLAERHLLLVLDNVEHLLAEGAHDEGRFVALLLDLLQHAPMLAIIVTSRRQLHLRTENLFLLDGLAYPTENRLTATTDPEELLHYDAIQLFVEQAQRVKKDFVWADEAIPIVQICQTLQGMPLGIELAAANVPQHDCTMILAKLTDNLAQIQSNFQDAPTRHRSLSAVFAYSWALLSPAQQRLLAHCAIFQGGFTWDDLRALVADGVVADLQVLVDHCLLQQNDGRYNFHPLVQQYASERQVEWQIDTAALAARHSHYFLEKINQQRAAFYSLALPTALAAVAQDWANIHAAWQWAVQAGRLSWLDRALDTLCAAYYFRRHHEEGLHLWRDTAVALERQLETCLHVERLVWPRLAARLQIKQARHLSALQHIEEAVACVAPLLTQSALEQEIEFELLLIQSRVDRQVPEENSRRLIHLKDWIENPRLLGEYWLLIAFQQKELGDVLAAYNAGTKSLPYYQAINDYAGQVASHRSLAITCLHLGNLGEAQQLLETAMQWATQRQDLASEVGLLEILGIVYSRIGDHGMAMHAFTSAQHFYQQVGRQTTAQSIAMNLALECAFLGDYAAARRHYELLLKQLTGLPQSDRSICYTKLNLGLLLHTIGEQAAALTITEAALSLARTLQLPYLEGYALNNLGHIFCSMEKYAEAATAYQAALALREQLEETFLALETRAGLARLAFTVGDLSLAQEWINPILAHLENGTLDGVEEPFRVYLTCYLVLHAAGDSRAEPLVRQMQKELQTQADRITDPTLRSSFLTQVPYHREIMALRI